MIDSLFRLSQTRNFLYHQQLASIKSVMHGFSLRHDPGLQREFNLGLNDYQPRDIVMENRKRLIEAVAGTDVPLFTARQIHSDDILTIKDRTLPNRAPEGDALVTRLSGVLLGIQSADCLPIIVIDPSRKVIAAIHGGWRGLLKRIVVKTVKQMEEEFSTNPADILAVIGPGIGPCCYEVGEEIIQSFSESCAGGISFSRDFPSTRPGKPTSKALDLSAVGTHQLLEGGVLSQHIFNSEFCTSCRTDLFFSHRAESGKTGRFMGVIGLTGI
ncbi:MAG: peptidoglycan editing factor PgeF [Terriglobia bacterium]